MVVPMREEVQLTAALMAATPAELWVADPPQDEEGLQV
jgi:hypothetical protein